MKLDKPENVDVGLAQSAPSDVSSAGAFPTGFSATPGNKADPKMNIEAMSAEDLEYIHTHGAHAYAEKLQNRIVEEIRQKLLFLMGLSDTPEDQISDIMRQTIEGLISLEIHTRMQESSEMETGADNDNSTYLKTMLLTQGNYGFFNGQPVTSLAEFEESVATRRDSLLS